MLGKTHDLDKQLLQSLPGKLPGRHVAANAIGLACCMLHLANAAPCNIQTMRVKSVNWILPERLPGRHVAADAVELECLHSADAALCNN